MSPDYAALGWVIRSSRLTFKGRFTSATAVGRPPFLALISLRGRDHRSRLQHVVATSSFLSRPAERSPRNKFPTTSPANPVSLVQFSEWNQSSNSC